MDTAKTPLTTAQILALIASNGGGLTEADVLALIGAAVLGIAVGNPITLGAANRVLFSDAAQNVGESALLKFDGANLQVGETPPAPYPLSVIKTDFASPGQGGTLLYLKLQEIGYGFLTAERSIGYYQRGLFDAINNNGIWFNNTVDGYLRQNVDSNTQNCSREFWYQNFVNKFSNAGGKHKWITNAGVELMSLNDVGQLKIGSHPFSATNLTVKTNYSSKVMTVGGKLKEYHADSGNLVANGETDLFSYPLEPYLFSYWGDTLYFSYSLQIMGAGVTTKRFKIYFAGTAIYDSGANIYEVNDVVVITGYMTWGSGGGVYYSISVNDNTFIVPVRCAVGFQAASAGVSNILKLTGESAGVGSNNNDIVAKSGYVRFEEMSHN